MLVFTINSELDSVALWALMLLGYLVIIRDFVRIMVSDL